MSARLAFGRTLPLALLASSIATLLVAATASARGANLNLTCKPVGSTCTVLLPITAADNGVHVVITTPRRNIGETTTVNTRNFAAMYDVTETTRGLTFDLEHTTDVAPGTVVKIVFTLAPVAGSASTPATTSSSSGSGGGGAITLSGPTKNVFGSSFIYKATAQIKKRVEFLAYEVGGTTCSATPSAYAKDHPLLHEAVPVGTFDATFRLIAQPAGSFSLCTYLVDPATNASEAHAGAHWTNAS